MPVFKWNAIDLAAHVSYGIDFAVSKAELVQLLKKRNLGLMQCVEWRSNFYQNKLSLLVQLNFFHDLRVLLNSGMPLPQVLQLFLNQTKNQDLRCIIGYLLYQVQDQGQSFGMALNQFKSVFGNLVVVVLQAGFNVGNLAQALGSVCSYLEHKLQLQRELRRAILMPALTLVLFIALATLVFVVIVPQFAHIFNSSNLALDDSTKLVIAISDFLRSRQALISILALWLNCLLLYIFFKNRFGQKIWHLFLLYLPVIGNLIKYQNLFSFLQAAALLIKGGIPVVEAFESANLAISNVVLQKYSMRMTKLVEQGTSVSLAMQQAASILFTSEVIAMTAVGEESGNLDIIFARSSEIYEQRFKARLNLLLSLLQPVLIIGLGLLVALLIFAIYMPIFNIPALME